MNILFLVWGFQIHLAKLYKLYKEYPEEYRYMKQAVRIKLTRRVEERWEDLLENFIKTRNTSRYNDRTTGRTITCLVRHHNENKAPYIQYNRKPQPTEIAAVIVYTRQ